MTRQLVYVKHEWEFMIKERIALSWKIPNILSQSAPLFGLKLDLTDIYD